MPRWLQILLALVLALAVLWFVGVHIHVGS